MTEPAVAGRSRWAGFLCGFALVWGALQLAGAGAFSGVRGLAGLAAVVITAVGVALLVFRTPVRELPRRLGFGRPATRPIVLALLAGAAIQVVYPLLWLTTGRSVELRAGWVWLLVGLLAYHGLAEEIAWRAYAFGRLRPGRSVRRALLLTMPLVAATHVPIVLSAGAAVGIGAITVAAVTTVPFVRLYESGRGTIWAPAVLHSAIDSFKLVSVPADLAPTFSLLLVAASLTVPLAVLPALRSRTPGGRRRDRLCAPRRNVVRSAPLGIPPCSTSRTPWSDEAPSSRNSTAFSSRR